MLMPVAPASRHSFWTDLKYLWLEQILEIRTTWPWFLIFSLLMPASMLFGFARMGSGLADQHSLIYIISGSAIFAAANDGLTMMALRLGALRREGALIYYASLPISKQAFILALLGARLMLMLPGMVLPMILAPLLYPVQIHLTIWIVPLILLTAITLAAVGMAIGVLISNLDLIQIVCNAVLFLLLLAAPLFIPLNALPAPLRIISYLLPPSYAADALRHALTGTIGPAFYLDVALLCAMTLASLVVLPRWIQWRLN